MCVLCHLCVFYRNTFRKKGANNSVLPATPPHRFWRIVQMSEKQLPTNPAVGRLKHMVEEVKLTVPVVADLRSGTLMDRHWEVLDGVLGMDIREQGSATFKQMMEVTKHPIFKHARCSFHHSCFFLPAGGPEIDGSANVHNYRTPFGRLIQFIASWAILQLCEQ